jgi:hypothetical protein
MRVAFMRDGKMAAVGHYRIGDQTDTNIRLDAIAAHECDIPFTNGDKCYSIWMHEHKTVPISALEMPLPEIAAHPALPSEVVRQPDGSSCLRIKSIHIHPQLLERASTRPIDLSTLPPLPHGDEVL